MLCVVAMPTEKLAARAREALEKGQSVLVLVTSKRQEAEARRALPGAAVATRPIQDRVFDLTLDDR